MVGRIVGGHDDDDDALYDESETETEHEQSCW